MLPLGWALRCDPFDLASAYSSIVSPVFRLEGFIPSDSRMKSKVRPSDLTVTGVCTVTGLITEVAGRFVPLVFPAIVQSLS